MRHEPRNAYLAVAVGALARSVRNRQNLTIQLFTAGLWLVVPLTIWRFTFVGREQVGSFTWAQMQRYLLLAFAANALSDSSSVFFRLTQSIRTGSITFDLLRPVGFMRFHLVSAFSMMLPNAAVVVAVVAVYLGLSSGGGAPSAAQVPLVLASLVFSHLTRFLLSFQVAVLSCWTHRAWGLGGMLVGVIQVFSGVLVPLPLLPSALRPLAEWLPFRSLVSAPVSLFMERVRGEAALSLLAFQTTWVLLLFISAYLLWSAGYRRVQTSEA